MVSLRFSTGVSDSRHCEVQMFNRYKKNVLPEIAQVSQKSAKFVEFCCSGIVCNIVMLTDMLIKLKYYFNWQFTALSCKALRFEMNSLRFLV